MRHRNEVLQWELNRAANTEVAFMQKARREVNRIKLRKDEDRKINREVTSQPTSLVQTWMNQDHQKLLLKEIVEWIVEEPSWPETKRGIKWKPGSILSGKRYISEKFDLQYL